MAMAPHTTATVVVSVMLSVVATGIVGFAIASMGDAPQGAVPVARDVDPDLRADLDILLADLDDLVQRLERLEEKIQDEHPSGGGGGSDPALIRLADSLARRIEALENASRPGGASPSGDNPPVVVDEQGNPVELAPDAVEAAVQRVLEQREAEEQAAREEQRRQRMLEAQEYMTRMIDEIYPQKLAAITEQLQLSQTQREAVEEALEARRAGILAQYDPSLDREARPDWGEVNNVYDQAMQRILTPQQYESYKEQGLDDFSMRNRGRR